MGKRISDKEIAIFRNEYKKWLKELCETLIDYREGVIQTMKETDLKTFDRDKDFKNMGKAALFHKIKVFYEQEAAIEQVNDIVNWEDEE